MDKHGWPLFWAKIRWISIAKKSDKIKLALVWQLANPFSNFLSVFDYRKIVLRRHDSFYKQFISFF